MYGSEPSMKKTIGKYTLNYIMDSTFGPKYDQSYLDQESYRIFNSAGMGVIPEQFRKEVSLASLSGGSRIRKF